MLEKHLEKQLNTILDRCSLCKNPFATHIVTFHKDLIIQDFISDNPNAIDFLKENIKNVSWEWLYTNPAIFEIAYAKMKHRNKYFTEEIMIKCFHPKRLVYFLKKYHYCIGNDEYVNDRFEIL